MLTPARAVLLRIAWLLLLCTTASAAPADGEVYENADFGFRLTLPAGWTTHPAEVSERSLRLLLLPASGDGTVQLVVRINPAEARSRDPEAVRQQTLRYIQGQPEYGNPRTLVARVLDQDAPGLIVDAHTGARPLRVQLVYIVGQGLPVILQSVAPADEFDDLAGKFSRVWDSFQWTDLSPERAGRLALSALARRCGTEIAWASTWEEAAGRARADQRPILVYARLYPGFQLSDDTMAGPFMDTDIVQLVNRRYVALRLGRGVEVPFADAELYGLGPNTFGTATLIVSPDGRVLSAGLFPQHGFLVDGLRLDPKLPGPPPAGEEQAVDLALRRGELERAGALLAHASTARELRQLAHLHRLRRQGSDALAALERARSAPGGEALAVDLDLDRAVLLARVGRPDQAVALLQAVLAAHPGHAREAEALYRLGAVQRVRSSQAEAEQTWMRLVTEQPESRWAWQAAGAMTSTAWSLERGGRQDWPAEELYDAIRPPRYEPTPVRRADRAEQQALTYLLAHQQPDGSWVVPSEMGRVAGDPPGDFELAITAICGQALLRHLDRDGADEALERATRWLLAACAEARAAGDRSHFMDYAVWSRTYLLWFLGDLVAAERRTHASLQPLVEGLLDDLAQRQKPGGGWSYYVTGDLSNRDQPAAQSISFTTAAAILGLLRVREAGFDVPETLLERGLDCLQALRNANGTFTYMHDTAGSTERPATARPGAAGRGPLCELALLRGQRGSRKALRASLEIFLDHRQGLSSETGKPLMHTGPDGQGSHYLMFDYANTAAAIAELPRRQRSRFRLALLETMLSARTADGAFVDNSLQGPAYGAGMALLAFERLRAGR